MFSHAMKAKTAVNGAVCAARISASMKGMRFKRGLAIAALALLGTSAHASITLSKTFISGSWSGVGAPPAPLAVPVDQGSDAWLRISVINSSSNPVTALNGTDDFLPGASGLFIAPVPAAFASASCSGPGVYSAVPGSTTFSFSGLTVPAFAGSVNGQCDIYVKVRAVGSTSANAGDITTMLNTIPPSAGSGPGVRGLDGGVPVSNASAASQSIQARKLPDPSVSKGFSPSTVPMGGSSTATITISNNAAVPVDLTTLTENLPATLTATSTPTVLCAGTGTPSVATSMGGSFPSLTFPASTTLAANSTCTISFTVRANAQAGNGYTASNSIPANALGNSRALNSPAASANLSVQSPLLTTKSFSPATAAANQSVLMTVTLQNRSAFGISAGSFTDNLPGAVSGGGVMSVVSPVVAVGGNAGGCSSAAAFSTTATAVSASGLTIPANSSCSYTVPVIVNNDGTYNNTIASTSYTSADSNVGTQSNGPASASLTAYDQITASKAAQDPTNVNLSAGAVAPGNRVVYRVAISNYSSSAVTDVQVTDPLPQATGAQATYIPSAPGTLTSSLGAGCTGPSSISGTPAAPIFSGIGIPGGSGPNPSTCVLEFWVQIPDNWPVNTLISNSIPSNNISYNGGTITLQGPAVVDNRPYVDRLVASKSVLPNVVFQGDTAVVTVTLFNNSYNLMTAAEFDDAALFGASNSVRMASPANPSTTCAGTPAYTFTPGGSSFKVTGLSVPARGNCVVTWRVVGINPGGPYTNTLPFADIKGTVDNGAGPVTFSATTSPTTNMTVNSVLLVNKSFNPSTVGGVGGVSRASVTVQNIGNSAITGLVGTDNLPGGLTVANPANGSTTCGGASVVTAVPGASVASVSNVTLYANTSCVLQFDVISSSSLPSVNTINPGDVTANNGVFNASPASATLNKYSPGVLNISKAFDPPTLASVGAVSRLTVNVQNTSGGAVNLTNTGFIDNMPSGMVLSSSPNAVSNCAGAVLTANPGASSFAMANASVPAGGGCLVAVNVTLVASDSFVNVLPVGVVTNDQQISNPSAFSTTLATLATLGIEKSFNPPAAAPNTPTN